MFQKYCCNCNNNNNYNICLFVMISQTEFNLGVQMHHNYVTSSTRVIYLPESASWMVVDWTEESTRWCQVLCHRLNGQEVLIRARRVRELDRDWLSGALWDGSVQLFDRPLGFVSLVEADESDSFRDPCDGTNKCQARQQVTRCRHAHQSLSPIDTSLCHQSTPVSVTNRHQSLSPIDTSLCHQSTPVSVTKRHQSLSPNDTSLCHQSTPVSVTKRHQSLSPNDTSLDHLKT